MYSLPVKRGGLGVRNPIEGSKLAFSTSREATDCLVSSILNQDDFDQTLHKTKMREARKNHEEKQNAVDKDKLDELLAILPADQKRAIRRIIDNNCSLWLTSLPLLKDNFDLSATEFRDALCARYRKPLKRSFSRCDGCQQDFDLQHALSCKKGGLVTLRHNEIRDAVGDLASILWKGVKREPVVKEPDIENGTPTLIADLSARGVWDRQSAASFDIRVTDTDAPSYQNRNPMNVLKTAEIEKKNKYGPALIVFSKVLGVWKLPNWLNSGLNYVRFEEFVHNVESVRKLFMRGELSRTKQWFQVELRLANWSY